LGLWDISRHGDNASESKCFSLYRKQRKKSWRRANAPGRDEDTVGLVSTAEKERGEAGEQAGQHDIVVTFMFAGPETPARVKQGFSR
jgi:hypothetical protein